MYAWSSHIASVRIKKPIILPPAPPPHYVMPPRWPRQIAHIPSLLPYLPINVPGFLGDDRTRHVCSLPQLQTVKGRMDLERTYPTPKLLLFLRAGTDVKVPKQPRLLRKEMRSTTIDRCRNTNTGGSEQGRSISLGAIVGVKPGKTTNLTALHMIVVLQIDSLPVEMEIDNESQKQLNSRGCCEDAPHAKKRLDCYYLPRESDCKCLGCFLPLSVGKKGP